MLRLLGKIVMFALLFLLSPVILLVAVVLGCFGIACVPPEKKGRGNA